MYLLVGRNSHNLSHDSPSGHELLPRYKHKRQGSINWVRAMAGEMDLLKQATQSLMTRYDNGENTVPLSVSAFGGSTMTFTRSNTIDSLLDVYCLVKCMFPKCSESLFLKVVDCDSFVSVQFIWTSGLAHAFSCGGDEGRRPGSNRAYRKASRYL